MKNVCSEPNYKYIKSDMERGKNGKKILFSLQIKSSLSFIYKKKKSLVFSCGYRISEAVFSSFKSIYSESLELTELFS